MELFICHYGCGRVAIKQNKSGNWMCDTSSNKCPENKRKNSEKLKEAYSSGKRVDQKTLHASLSEDKKKLMGWSKGLTKENDCRVNAIASKTSNTMKGRKKEAFSPIHKKNLSEARLKIIQEGRYDSSGRKGHRGHYDGEYFHSSWELAYYVWKKEVFGNIISRNTKYRIEYEHEKMKYNYIPDFIENGDLVEIKGYLWSQKDSNKYHQTKDKVKYLFKEDLIEAIQYCKSKYSNSFWEQLYG